MNVQDLKQAGFSDIEIRDHLAPSLKAAGFSDGEINAHFGRVESRGYLDTFATGLKHGVRGLPEAAGRAMQFVDRPGGLPWGDWGQSLVDVTERAREAHPEEERARELETLSEWHPKRMVRAAGEMIPMSVSAIALGAPVGAGVALAAPTAPLWVPTIAAATAGGAFFGLSEAGQTYDLSKEQLGQQAIAAGQDPNTPEIADQIEQTSRKAANQTGLIEFIGESVSNIPVFAWMKIGKPAMKQPLKQVLKAPTWKGFMKNMATLFAAEVSTEEGQTILQNITLKKHGVLPDQPWHEGTGEAFGATIILTAFLGGGAHSISEAQRRSTIKALESRNADPKKRLRAAGAVAAQMTAVDPELGEAWFEEAASLISRKLPISTQLEHYVKKPSEIRKEGEGKIEPMASPGGAVKDIAEELTPKPMPEDLIPGEIPGIWPKAPAPEPMTSGLSGDELSQMSFEHFQPEMGEVSITEPPMMDPLAIQRKAEELLETQQIELPGFTERGFTMQQETEMQALNDEEAKMQRRLDNLNVVPVKTKKIRQMIIEATYRLEQIKTRRNEIQLERLQVLQQAVAARQAEMVPTEPAAPEVVPPPISVEASAPVGMETVITEDQLDDLFDQIAAEEEVEGVPEAPAIVSFSERSPAEKKLVEEYNKKMTSSEWQKDYATTKEPHWMEGKEHSPLADEMVRDLDREGIKKASILEIGIGNGRDSIFLASKGHRVTGIDLAKKAVETAKEKSKGMQNISFEVGNAENLKFAPESFDAVYSVAALHSTPLRFTLREINRVLRPGGTAKLFLYTKTKTGAKWISYWTPGEIKQFATEEGFKVKKFREGKDVEPIEIPGVEGKVEQETHLVVTTLEKPATRTEPAQEAISPEKAGEPIGEVEIVEPGAPGAQISEKETRGYGTPKEPDVIALSKDFKKHLDKKLNKNDVKKIVAETYGVDVSELTPQKGYNHRAVEEAFEYAIVQRAREIVAQDISEAEKLKQLTELYENQPILAEKTTLSLLNRAYSTPINLAYVASLAADVKGADMVLEPTAGTGALLIEAEPATTRAVELDETRFNVLDDQGFVVSKGDFFKQKDIKAKSFDSVIMNPPFAGKKVELAGYKISKLEHAIAIEALRKMKDDGKAAMIIGGHNFDGKNGEMRGSDRIFFNYLYSHYNVTHNIDIPGDIYRRQGASFPIRLITIEGRKKAIKGVAPYEKSQTGVANTIREAYNIIRGEKHAEIPEPEKGVLGAEPGGPPEGKAPVGGPEAGRGKGAEPSGVREPVVAEGGIPGETGVEPERGKEPVGVGRKPVEPAGGRRPGRPGERPGVGGVVAGVKRPGEKPPVGREGLGEQPEGRKGEQAPPGKAAGETGAVEPERGPEGVQEPEPGRLPERPLEHLKEAGEHLTDAAKEAFAGIGDVLKKHGLLKDEKKAKGKAGKVALSVEKIDEEIYNELSPHFTVAWNSMKAAGQSIQDFLRAVIKQFGATVKPYVSKWYKDNVLAQQAAKETALQVQYKSRSANQDNTIVIPKYMRDRMDKALNALEKRRGKVDEIATEILEYENKAELFKALSGPQIDAVALGIDAIQRGKALIAGDMTGVGKGRIAAALIRYGILQGHKPIFFTEKPYLFSDMIARDLPAVCHDGKVKIKPFVVNANEAVVDDAGNEVFKSLSGKKRADALRSGEIGDANSIYLTYSQVQNPKTSLLPLDFIRKHASGNLIILDEAHNAGGKESNTGLFLRDVLQHVNGALYLSATFSKRPDTMPLYFRTSMGDATAGMDALEEAIERGGVVLQEVMTKNLASVGEYVRREQSYSGVRIDHKVDVENTARDAKRSDDVTDILRDIVAFDKLKQQLIEEMNDEAVKDGKRLTGDTHTSASVDSANFASTVHIVIRQLLFTLKADATINRAIEHLKSNKKVVVVVENTMEALIDHAIKNGTLRVGDRVEIAFNDLMQKTIKGTLRYKVTDAFGNESWHELDPKEFQGDIKIAWDSAINKIEKLTSDLPALPLDYMKMKIEKAGFKTAEISGRKYFVDHSDLKNPVLDSRGSAEIRDKRTPMIRFNNGEVDFMIVTASGTGGWSGHASKDFKDQRPRVMLMTQPHLDINRVVQAMGRINRKGQVVLPEYEFLLIGIPAETRPAAILQKKLNWLNANMTATSKSIVELDVPDIINKYGDEIVAQYCVDNKEFNEMINDPLKIAELQPGKKPNTEDAAKRVTGRVALLPVEIQEQFYEEVVAVYNAYIEELDQLGRNDLVAQDLDLKASPIRKRILAEGTNENNPFASSTYIEECSCKILKKPLLAEQIQENIKKTLGDKSAKEFAGELKTNIEKSNDEFVIDKLQHLRKANAGKVVDKITVSPHMETWSVDTYKGKKKLHEYQISNDKELKALLGDEVFKKVQELKTKQGKEFREDIDDLPENYRVPPLDPRIRQRLHHINSEIDRLLVGRPFKIVLGEGISMVGILTHIKADIKPRKNAAVPSTVKAVFATNSTGVPIYSVPFSRTDQMIREVYHGPEQGEVENVLENWDYRLPKEERENREIVTGNLLQAYEMVPTGAQTINFTDNKGKIRTGILLPKDRGIIDDTISSRPVDSIYRWLVGDEEAEVFTHGHRMMITSTLFHGKTLYEGHFQVRLEGNKQQLFPYQNEQIISLMYSEGFSGRGKTLWGTVEKKNLREFLKTAQDWVGGTYYVNEELYQRWLERSGQGKESRTMLSVEKFKAENFNDRLIKDVFRSALEEVLPKSLAKMTDIRLAEVIKANKTVLKSIQQHGYSEQEAFDIMAGRGPVRIAGRTQVLKTESGAIPIVSFAYHASLKTVYHEGFHVAMKMVMPEGMANRVIEHYGNEEVAARAFADFVLKEKGKREFKHPTWVRRVWDRLISFAKAIVSGFKKKGFDNVDDVFRALMNKEYARLSPAEVAERIDRAETEAQLEVAAMDPTASVIDDYANKYISWEHKPERRSIKEIFHSLYTRVVDRMHPITNLTKIGEEQLKKAPVELAEEEYAKLSETEQWYYDYVREHGELPAGMDPRLLTRRFLGVIGIADTKLRSRKGAKDAIIEMTPEGELEKVYDKTLEAILKDAVNLQDLMTYMVAERDIELSGRLSAYDQEIIGTHPEESRAVMDAIKAKHGDRFKDGIQDIANHIREWSDAVLLKPLLDVGALKQETYDKIKKANEFYIPYFRVMHELEAQGHVPKNANLFQPKSIPIKVIRGSHKQIVNPIESLITMAYRVADFTERARVAGSVAKMRLLSPEIAELIYKVKPKFIPHRVLLKEELDPVMMGQISKVVGAMGSTIETLHSIGRGTLGKFIKYMNQMGVTVNDKIQRRFASTERTLSHELGHLIDDRFDLQRLLMATPEMKKELRKIADQRAGEGASNYYLKYIRKREEQVAEFVNRYINAPDQVKEIAPKAYEAFEKFCKGHKELELIPQIRLSGQATLVPFEAKIWTRSPFTPEKDTIMVFEDGAKHYYKVPHDVFEAMESMSSQEMNFITKILGAPARWLRAGATLTFEFMTRNPLRDVVSAWAYGGRTGFGLRHWFKGFASTIKQDEHFRDWEAAGGPFSMLVSLDRVRTQLTVEDLTGKKSKLAKYAKNPIEALRLLSEAMEKTTRVGVYRAAIEKGLTPAQAMKEARDSTLDFARHGQNMRFVNQIIAFWNANVQGMDKLVRETVTAKERAQTIKRIVMGITLPSIGLWLMNHDDERYKELPGWQKNLFWIIICGKDGPIIRIPKPFELGIIFGSLVERFLDHVYEKDPKALQGAWEAMKQGASPGYIPTGLAPIIESAANYSFFLERPIEDEGIKRLPVEMRYKPWTTETAKLAGKLLNVSPVKLENWVRSWTGGLGAYAMKGLDYPLALMGIKPKTKLKEEGILKKIPGIKGLIAREPIGSASESVNRFYENMEGIIQAEQGLRNLQTKRDLEGYETFREEHPEYRLAKRTRKTAKRLSDLRSKKQRLYESDAPEEEKREKIKALNRRMTDIARAFNKWYNQKLEELKKQQKKPTAGEYATGTWVNSYRQQANP